jgi:hypothetical protein
VSTSAPSAENRIELTASPWPLISAAALPVLRSTILTTFPAPAYASFEPSALSAIAFASAASSILDFFSG